MFLFYVLDNLLNKCFCGFGLRQDFVMQVLAVQRTRQVNGTIDVRLCSSKVVSYRGLASEGNYLRFRAVAYA